MRLMTAHKILIATGCAFFLLFAALQWRGVGAGAGTPLGALLGLLASILLGAYLVTLRGK